MKIDKKILKETIKDIDKIKKEVDDLLKSEDTDIMINNIYKISDDLKELRTKIYYEVEDEN